LQQQQPRRVLTGCVQQQEYDTTFLQKFLSYLPTTTHKFRAYNPSLFHHGGSLHVVFRVSNYTLCDRALPFGAKPVFVSIMVLCTFQEASYSLNKDTCHQVCAAASPVGGAPRRCPMP
jgi:hypothetical protein